MKELKAEKKAKNTNEINKLWKTGPKKKRKVKLKKETNN